MHYTLRTPGIESPDDPDIIPSHQPGIESPEEPGPFAPEPELPPNRPSDPDDPPPNPDEPLPEIGPARST